MCLSIFRYFKESTSIMGINFVPLNTPLKSHLEACSAGVVYFGIPYLIPVGIFTTTYFLFFTRFWYLVILYLIWIWFIGNEIELGNRSSNWVRSWRVFRYAHSYFPVGATIARDFQLDPKKSYMACVFPHGVVPFGSVLEFATDASKIRKMIPHHIIHPTSVRWMFYAPLLREFYMSLGFVSVSSKNICQILNDSKGGRIISLIIGGGEEMKYCYGGKYCLVLKNRKGFVKLAIQTGTALIPVFTFGETSIYNALITSPTIRRFVDNMTKKYFGYPIILPRGRGVFQLNFGVVPFKRPLNVVLGTPIKVPKVENPSQELINSVHQHFIEKLTELFEEHKYKFEEDPENCKLDII